MNTCLTAYRVLVDQFMFAPTFIPVFYSSMLACEGKDDISGKVCLAMLLVLVILLIPSPSSRSMRSGGICVWVTGGSGSLPKL